jgi:signal transduction histidine kinase
MIRDTRLGGGRPLTRLLAYLPRGNTLDEEVWQRRHLFLQWVLLLHVVGLYVFGLWRGISSTEVAVALVAPFACLVVGRLVPHRRLASLLITAGLVYCSAALVGFSGGSIEAHFHFFIMIGFIALYQDWVPFLWNIAFTVASHGIGSVWQTNLIFNHPAGQASPWTWSTIHGVAVLAACIGVVVFWQNTETEQQKSLRLTKQLADTEITRRKFTSDMLVNLARRNQSLLYRQLGLINQLEEQEKDPDALADLFRLDHLATRIRRNAESLLVLSGEEPPRTWGRPVLLVDVVRAAIAETEDLDRVVFAVDERQAVLGNAVADVTHMLAELVENAVHFSPPEASVIIRTRPYLQTPGAHVLTVEDWGVGIRPEDLAQANDLLAHPREVDLSVSQRLGLHVVARLAQRHGIAVSLTPTPGCGVTAAVVLPPELFSSDAVEPDGAPAERPASRLAMAAVTRQSARPATGQAVAPAPAATAVAAAPPWPASEDVPDLTGPPTPDGPGPNDARRGGPGRPATGLDPVAPDLDPVAPDLDPVAPDLDPVAPDLDYAAPDPDYAAPDLDYVAPDPDYVAPDLDYVAPGPDRLAPGPDRVPSGPDRLVPDPDRAAPGGTGGAGGYGPDHLAARGPGGDGPEWSGWWGSPGGNGASLDANGASLDANGASLDANGDHRPGPAAAAAPPAAPAEPRLTRRVPQAHLAPELRRRQANPAAPPAPPPDADQARAALSRYQASREAARAVVDRDDGNGAPPAGDGGWK